MTGMKWAEATAEELAKAAKNKKALAILPLGNLESHGYHLPAGTDSLLAQGFCELLERRLEAKGFAPVVLPPTNQAIRSMPEFNLDLPLHLYAKLVRHLVLKIVSNGFANVVIVAGHTPNKEVAKTIAREVTAKEKGAKIVSFDWFALGDDEGFADLHHAGDVETSAAAYFFPRLVRENKIFDNPAALKSRAADYSVAGRGVEQATGKKACRGIASKHSAEKGKRFVESAVSQAVKIIEAEF